MHIFNEEEELTTCKVCGSESFVRIKRFWWMRLAFPASKRLECFHCHKIYWVMNKSNKKNQKTEKET